MLTRPLLLSALSLSVLAFITPSFAAESTWWEALPAETLVSMHVPDGQAVVEVLRPTLLHALCADADRLQKIKALIAKEGAQEFDTFMEHLGEFDLSLNDFPKLFQGESGMAFVASPHIAGGRSLAIHGTGLLWISPGKDLADKCMRACDRLIQHGEETGKFTRREYSLEEYEVIELTLLNKRSMGLIHRHGDTIIMALGDGPSAEKTKERLVQFITAHDLGADAHAAASHAQRMMLTAGVPDSLAAGVSLMDIFVDPQAIIHVFPKEEMVTPVMNVGQMIDVLGLNDVQAIAMRVSIDDSLMRQSFFIALKQPLRGVLALLAQPDSDATPESWVPDTVYSYAHVGVDLLKIFATAKELTIAFGGQDAAAQLMMMEQMPQMYFGVDLQTLLGSFGKKVVLIDYGDKLPEEAAAMVNAGVGLMNTGPFSNRVAMLWQMNDAAPLRNAMTQLQAMAQMFGGQVANEQGATGIRFDLSTITAGLDVGIFVNDNQFIMSLGSGVSELILRDAKGGHQQTLERSELVQRAHGLLSPEKSLLWQVQDTNRIFKSAFTVLRQGFQAGILKNEDREMAMVLEVFPTSDDLEGVLGIGVGDVIMEENGWHARSVLELGMSK